MEKPLSLEDLLPQEPEFTLKATGKAYRLRLINLEDQVWIKKTFGTDAQLKAVFEELQWEHLSRIIFRQLEDKSDFLARDVEEINDDGEKITQRLTGPYLLMKSVSGMDEAFSMLAALNKAMALSSPVVEDYLKAEFEKEVKKNQTANRAGRKSSTSSRTSTVTP